jgi:hypothetical protein
MAEAKTGDMVTKKRHHRLFRAANNVDKSFNSFHEAKSVTAHAWSCLRLSRNMLVEERMDLEVRMTTSTRMLPSTPIPAHHSELVFF